MITKVEFSKINEINKPSLNKDSKVKYRGKELTPRQVAILEELGIGATNAEIATALNISQRTVETHLTSLRKLISNEIGYRLGDRELVLFAKDMLEGYKVFISLEAQLQKREKDEEKKLIEDWDDDEDPLELPLGFKSFNGKLVPKEELRKYKLKTFEIDEFKVESKNVSYTNGVYKLT